MQIRKMVSQVQNPYRIIFGRYFVSPYVKAIESHLDRLVLGCADEEKKLWPSVLDVSTGKYPESEHVPQRVYRLIGAPRGNTLYCDQPLVVAALELSRLTGNEQYATAAMAYVDTFLAKCVAENNMFRWGNHAYFDVFENQVVEFSNGYHELRPITPAWEVFWQRDPTATEAYIRTMSRRHVYDPQTGGFNRHDDGIKSHAFLEAGGILSESLAWLYSKTKDRDLLTTSLQIAHYSYSHRNPTTGLVPNEPDMGRWDAKVCTSEIGLWAQCLLTATTYSSNEEFVAMARQAVEAYLHHAFDAPTGKYRGQVSVETGQHVISPKLGYWPREYANAWNTDQWPMHDYPMALAETCLTLFNLTDETHFEKAARQLADDAWNTRPSQTGQWAYAENYGRCIHLLTRAGRQLNKSQYLKQAEQLADEAVNQLQAHDMFQGYPDSGVYESVDGVGFLFLAMLNLHYTTCDPQRWGFRF